MVFEITETTLVSDEPAARAFVEGLHAFGCKIALDDFGTAYGLATAFGLKTVGEGLEDEETLDVLRELGVDYAQGFHCGRPAPL